MALELMQRKVRRKGLPKKDIIVREDIDLKVMQANKGV